MLLSDLQSRCTYIVLIFMVDHFDHILPHKQVELGQILLLDINKK